MPSLFPFNASLPFNIGVDLLHLPRLRQLISRRGPAAFAKRILTSQEHEVFTRQLSSNHDNTIDTKSLQYLGVRWAAKEAAYKASSSHPAQKLCWKDVEIRYKENKQPYLAIRQGESLTEGLLSISHDGDYVIAMAMVSNNG